MFVFTQCVHEKQLARKKRYLKLRLRNEWITMSQGANFTEFFK